MQNQPKRSNVIPAVVFTLLVATAFALFFVPAFIIQPFRYQSSRALLVAIAIRQQAPIWTLILTAAALFVTVLLWRRISVWKRIPLVLGLCLASAATVMARIDYFEWMFHPVTTTGFQSADQAKLDSSEMVMAVRFANDSRAYPIRAMAYHHVFNDVVAGVPIVVTY
jgi:hypothetical protein